MQKIWKIKDRTEDDLMTQLLRNRNISEEEAEVFLKPDYSKLHDPFLFKDMEKAVQRLWKAIENKEKIVIYSDYDADAVTANAVVYRALKFLGVQAEIYIPDRFTEGYGLNLEAFKKVKDAGAGVVITVDCGTNSVDEAKYCKENGIDLIITDHHEITGDIPDAYALINPKNPNESYPYDQLVGVGVAYKLVCALLSKREKHSLPEGYEKWLLDLVAIGTVADCHELVGENRIFVKYGLQVLSKTKWIGLSKLMDLAGITENGIPKKPLDTYTIGFIIAPRINAAGRIEHASSAFNLAICDNPVEAIKLANDLEQLNKRRQLLTENVMTEARLQLASIADRKILVAYGTDWPKGVVGLVAGKLTEEFGRPVLVMEKGELECTGSARSVANFNIVNALTNTRDILVKYGGHAAAAGFTVRNEHLDAFQKNLLDYAETHLSDEDLIKVLEIDAILKDDEVRIETAEKIDALEPFGIGNPRPKFVLKNAKVSDISYVGKEQQHVQITICAGESNYVKCIAFNFSKQAAQFSIGDMVDLVGEFLIDSWNGRKTLKLRVIDARKAEVNV